MIKQKKVNFDELAKTVKAAGLVGLGEVSDLGTSAILGATKTIKESNWEKKVLFGGILGNLAAGILDMDLPFANLGIESIAGLDSFVDNASDIAMGVAGASMAYKFANNVQELQNSNETLEEKLAKLGIVLDDEKSEPIQEQSIFERKNDITKQETKQEQNIDLAEQQEKLLLKQLLKKYGNELAEENL